MGVRSVDGFPSDQTVNASAPDAEHYHQLLMSIAKMPGLQPSNFVTPCTAVVRLLLVLEAEPGYRMDSIWPGGFV